MLRIAGAIKESIVDGPGMRFTLFTQGCCHGCKGCHNPQTHDVNGGYEIEAERIIESFKKNPILAGITFSGGEPIMQAGKLIPIAEEIVKMGKNCWIYSGYTYEELIKMDEDVLKLLSLCDVLVDGPFILEQKDLTLLFRGSKNQRLIDLKKSMEENKVVLWQNN